MEYRMSSPIAHDGFAQRRAASLIRREIDGRKEELSCRVTSVARWVMMRQKGQMARGGVQAKLDEVMVRTIRWKQ